MKAHFITTGFVLAWLVTPESLVIIGRVSGLSGDLVFIPLVMGVILAILCAALIHDARLVRHGQGGDAVLKSTYGRTVAIAIAMSGRVPVLLFVSTGILVSAGFAFNEIFVYWFPNFLFASLLLMALCILNLFNEKHALNGQVLFVGLAVFGLLTLIIMGSVTAEQNFTQDPLPQSELFSLSLVGMCFLLFLGFDFYRPKSKSVAPVLVILLLAFLLLSGWAMLAMKFVAPLELADSTISYLVVARTVNGEVGRHIMGLIVICGALSGVNGLLLVVRRTVAGLAKEKVLPATLGKGWPVAIVAAIIIETMMMTGVAGDKVLDTQLRATLLLWLFYLGCRSFAAGQQLSRIGAGGRVYGGMVGGAILLLMGALIAADEHAAYIVKFQAATLIGFLLLSLVWTKTYGGFSPK